MQLKDLLFGLVIIILTAIMHFVFKDLFLSLWAFFFFVLIYLESESASLAQSIVTGDVRLRPDQVPLIDDYYGAIKNIRTIFLTLTAISASFTYFAAQRIDVRIWALITVFLFAASFIAFSFELFLFGLRKRGRLRRHVVLNSIVGGVFLVVTAGISGEIAKFFGISLFEDMMVALIPFVVYAAFRLKFVRNVIFSIVFSKAEQAIRLLTLEEQRATNDNHTLKSLRRMKQKVQAFFVDYIKFESLLLAILRDIKDKKSQLALMRDEHPRVTRDSSVLYDNFFEKFRQAGESLEIFEPILYNGISHTFADYKKDGGLTGFVVYNNETKSTVSDSRIVAEVAACHAVLENTKLIAGSNLRIKLSQSFVPLSCLIQDTLAKTFEWMFIKDLSDWLSTGSSRQRAIFGGQLGLDMTAWHDYYLNRSILKIGLFVTELERRLFDHPSCELSSWIIEYQKQMLALCQEQTNVWKNRVKASETSRHRSLVVTSERVLRTKISFKEKLLKQFNQLESEINAYKRLLRW